MVQYLVLLFSAVFCEMNARAHESSGHEESRLSWYGKTRVTSRLMQCAPHALQWWTHWCAIMTREFWFISYCLWRGAREDPSFLGLILYSCSSRTKGVWETARRNEKPRAGKKRKKEHCIPSKSSL